KARPAARVPSFRKELLADAGGDGRSRDRTARDYFGLPFGPASQTKYLQIALLSRLALEFSYRRAAGIGASHLSRTATEAERANTTKGLKRRFSQTRLRQTTRQQAHSPVAGLATRPAETLSLD